MVNLPTNQDDKSNLISDAFMVGYVTFAGYLLSYFYELAYTQYFGVPSYFIDIKLSNVFSSIIIVGFFLGFIKIVLEFFVKIKFIEDTKIGVIRGILTFFLILMVIITLPSILNGDHLIMGVLIGHILSTLVIFFKAKSRLNKTHSEEKPILIIDWIFNKVIHTGRSLPVRNFLYSLVILCLISYGAGNFTATIKTKYLTLDTVPKRVVITQYDGFLLTVSIFENTHVFNTDFRILNRDTLSNENINLTLQSIGPLKQPHILKPLYER